MRITFILSTLFLILTITNILGVPLENTQISNVPEEVQNSTIIDSNIVQDSSIKVENEVDLETAASEDKSATTDYEDQLDALAEESENENREGSILDAFHQYVNRYGGGVYPQYPQYPPVGAYPAPITYGAVPVPVPAVYPAPYAVQTAYEGYLVPTTTASTTTTTTAATTTTTSSPLSTLLSVLNPINFFTNILPTIMMSTIFRVLAAIFSAIGMVLFSGAFTNAICNYTPLCDMGSRTATYFFRLGRSENVGRMLSEELTPERLSQAEEFVRKAIQKYGDLQNNETK